MNKNNENDYNGFSNYATWRVNLELIDDHIEHSINARSANALKTAINRDTADIAEDLERVAHEVIERHSKDIDGVNLAESYAGAFLDRVDWYELAELAKTRYRDALEYKRENIEYA